MRLVAPQPVRRTASVDSRFLQSGRPRRPTARRWRQRQRPNRGPSMDDDCPTVDVRQGASTLVNRGQDPGGDSERPALPGHARREPLANARCEGPEIRMQVGVQGRVHGGTCGRARSGRRFRCAMRSCRKASSPRPSPRSSGDFRCRCRRGGPRQLYRHRGGPALPDAVARGARRLTSSISASMMPATADARLRRRNRRRSRSRDSASGPIQHSHASRRALLRMLESKDHWQICVSSGALDLTFASRARGWVGSECKCAPLVQLGLEVGDALADEVIGDACP